MSALLSTQPALGACKSYQARRSAAKAASVCACKASVQHLQPTNIVYQHQIQESEQIGQLSRHTHKAEQQHLTAWQWQCAFIQSRPLSHTAAVLLGVATCLLQFHVSVLIQHVPTWQLSRSHCCCSSLHLTLLLSVHCTQFACTFAVIRSLAVETLTSAAPV